MEIIEPGKGHQCNSYRRNSQKAGSKKQDERQKKEEEIKYLSHYYEVSRQISTQGRTTSAMHTL